ncbi:MAG: TetR/AcrR family transcriptional regulator [Chloroflexi bacterium]|nr:TetR/AcrR family transcriptional regulator [Chloroflexota bacterium]
MKQGEQQEQMVSVSGGEQGTPLRKRPARRQAADFDRRILEVAQQLFAERGIEAVSMHQIAQAAGVGQGTLYRRYAHKGELILDLLDERIRQLLYAMQEDAQATDATPAIQRLDRVIARCVAFIEEQGPFLAAIMTTASDQPRERKFSVTYYVTSHNIIAGLLQEAIAEDALVPLDSTYTADALLAALDPTLYQFQRQTRGYSSEQILAGLRRIYIGGLTVRSKT